MAPKVDNQLQEALRDLYKSGLHSDLIVRCRGRDFKVHKGILSARCNFFRIACEEGRWLEGEASVITLGADTELADGCPIYDDNPDAIDLMLKFLYTSDYDVDTEPASETKDETEDEADHEVEEKTEDFNVEEAETTRDTEDFNAKEDGTEDNVEDSDVGVLDDRLNMHAKVYALGDKYEIPEMKSLALVRFMEQLDKGWDDAAFCEAAPTVFMTTPSHDLGLRNVVVSALHDRAQEHVIGPGIEELVLGYSELGWLLWNLAIRSSSKRKGRKGKSVNPWDFGPA